METSLVTKLMIAINLIVSGILITMSVSSYGAISKMNMSQENIQHTIENMKENSKYIYYDNTVVYPQDVVGIVLSEKGGKEVHIKTGNDLVIFNADTPDSAYTVEHVNSLVDQEKLYMSTLIKFGGSVDTNGVRYGGQVIGYQFTQMQDN